MTVTEIDHRRGARMRLGTANEFRWEGKTAAEMAERLGQADPTEWIVRCATDEEKMTHFRWDERARAAYAAVAAIELFTFREGDMVLEYEGSGSPDLQALAEQVFEAGWVDGGIPTVFEHGVYLEE
jgi:hypothetical protein